MSLRSSIAVLGLASAVGGAGLTGCASSRDGGFDSAVPGARIDAIEAALASWRAAPPPEGVPDLATRRNLVESLRATDPLVRFLAIEALADMTGERRGYRYDDPPARRAAAIESWRAWAEDPSGSPPSVEGGADPA